MSGLWNWKPEDELMPRRARLWPILARAGNISVLVLFVWFAVQHVYSDERWLDQSGHLVNRDFMLIWSGAFLAAQGHPLVDLFDPTVLHELQKGLFGRDVLVYVLTYPPQMLFFLMPLGQFSYLWALAIWSVVTLGAYLWATRQVALIAAPTTIVNLIVGQTGFLIGALYFGALRLLTARPLLSGVLLGALAIKPQLGVMVPVALFAARAWRTMASATAALGVLVLLSGWVFGWEAWRVWLCEALPNQAALMHEDYAGKIRPSAFAGARLLGLPTWAAWLIQAPFSLVAIWATWWAFSRLRRGLVPAPRAAAILLLSTSIATPYIFTYDLTLISPVVLLALSDWMAKRWVREGMRLSDLGELVVWLTVWLLPFLLFPLTSRGFPVGSLVLLAALGLAVWNAMADGVRTNQVLADEGDKRGRGA